MTAGNTGCVPPKLHQTLVNNLNIDNNSWWNGRKFPRTPPTRRNLVPRIRCIDAEPPLEDCDRWTPPLSSTRSSDENPSPPSLRAPFADTASNASVRTGYPAPYPRAGYPRQEGSSTVAIAFIEAPNRAFSPLQTPRAPPTAIKRKKRPNSPSRRPSPTPERRSGTPPPPPVRRLAASRQTGDDNRRQPHPNLPARYTPLRSPMPR